MEEQGATTGLQARRSGVRETSAIGTIGFLALRTKADESIVHLLDKTGWSDGPRDRYREHQDHRPSLLYVRP